MNTVPMGKCDYADLDRVLELIATLSRSPDLAQVMATVRGAARETTGADGAAFVLRDGASCHYADADGVALPRQGAPADHCVCGWAIAHGEAVSVADVRADPRVSAALRAEAAVESLLVMPVRPADPFGAIAVFWARAHQPGEREVHLLRALAAGAAVAMENLLRVTERTEALEREISERKQVEGALRESRQRLAGIVESATDAIVSIDGAQRIVLFNAAAEAMFRCPAAAIVGEPVERLIPERFRAEHAEHVRRFLGSGVTARRMGHLEPLRGLRADGEEFPIEASISRADLERGLLATVIVRDVSQRVETETALARSEARLRFVTDAAGIGYWDWDIVADRLEWSQRCRALFGIAEREPVSHARFLAALHPDDRARVDSAVRDALAEDGEYDVEYRAVRPDGCVTWIHATGRTRFGPRGEPLRIGGVVQDITARKAMEAALRESEARFRSMADTAPAMLWVTEPDGSCSFLSRGWYEYTGQPEGAGLGLGWLDAVHPDDREAVAAQFPATGASHGDFSCEFRVRHVRDGWRWVLDAGRPRRGPDGSFLGYIGSVIDITDRKYAEELMRQRALYDPLTGLPNRALTYEFCEHLLAGGKRGHVQCAVMFIDLDRFKPINDTYGHHVGDAVLKEVAGRLRGCVRREDLVGRLGGDEFVAVLAHVRAPREAAQAAVHILARLSEPFRLEALDGVPFEIDTTPSIGISLFPGDGDDIATLLERADLAMYRAKASGRGAFRFYLDE